jgi:hypothetical protein
MVMQTYQVMVVDQGGRGDGEAVQQLLAALEKMALATVQTGVMVQTDDARVLALVETLPGAVTMKGKGPARGEGAAEKAGTPTCMKCNRANAGRDGLCTQCRQDENKTEKRKRTAQLIEKIAAQSGAERISAPEGVIGAARLG